jgi:hypothetical protein
MPYLKTIFLPYMSAILPNGTRKTAVAKRNAVATQPSKTASMANSFPIVGSAILTEDPIKGMRKEVIVTTSNTAFLLTLVSIRFSTLPITPDFNLKILVVR